MHTGGGIFRFRESEEKNQGGSGECTVPLNLPDHVSSRNLRALYAFQDPPKPMLSLSPSSITGTRRFP